jgi:urocanate hydratase
LVLDGSKRVDEVIKSAIDWDVHGGVARRSWARNEHAVETMVEWNKRKGALGHATLPYHAEDDLVEDAVEDNLE